MPLNKLFDQIQHGSFSASNRIAMAPMTRCRAIGNLPNQLISTYYQQRAEAGLLITEGVSPSPNGLGYARIPGLFNQEQAIAWKQVTDSVHQKGGKIFVQLMHSGRVGSKSNLPDGAKLVAPSAVKCGGQIWSDSNGMVDMDEPNELTLNELLETKAEYVNASKLAIKAGFDGVELHAANGYLLEQFLSPHTNLRTDAYGGSIENRCKFVLETAQEVANAIGKDRTAIRLSPYGVNSSMQAYPEIDETYTFLASKLNDLGIIYIHLVDHSAMGAPEVPVNIKRAIRNSFSNILILSGGYDSERAAEDIAAGHADMIAFGRPFINNPDLVNRFKNNLSLNKTMDTNTFYSAGPEGYIDYPAYEG